MTTDTPADGGEQNAANDQSPFAFGKGDTVLVRVQTRLKEPTVTGKTALGLRSPSPQL
jgi:hypothetical protein